MAHDNQDRWFLNGVLPDISAMPTDHPDDESAPDGNYSNETVILSVVKKYFFLLPLTVATIPMPIYPVLLMANAMSLAGERPKNPAPVTLQGALFVTFLWASTLYPLALIFGWQRAFVQRSALRAFLIAMIPLLYLLLVVVLLAAALGPAGMAKLFGK